MPSRSAAQHSSAARLSELLGWLVAWPPAEESLTASDLADLLWLARTMPEAPPPTNRDQGSQSAQERKESHTSDPG